MPHFFISYAKKDTRELAIALNDALNALPDVTAWVDIELEIGQSWETRIQREIRKCDYFIVLYSPDLNRHLEDESLGESYVLTEIHYAKEVLKKPIIPVMVQNTTPPMSLIRLQHIDYTQEGLDLDYLRQKICGKAGIQLQNHQPVGMVSIPFVGSKSKALLPPPFDWCEIPAGIVTIEGKTQKLPAFLMAKYPITNTQYAEFIKADGYKNVGWWQLQRITEPSYWKDTNFNSAEQPVVGVSWYESIAFCLWLSEVSGEKIFLPTDHQWQRAAQGDYAYIYPWGNNWDANRCNNNVNKKGIGRTTPVGQYEGKGDSSFGVVDMVGNVSEWCLKQGETMSKGLYASNRCVLQGGSWRSNSTVYFRTDVSNSAHPTQTSNLIGFRIALNLE